MKKFQKDEYKIYRGLDEEALEQLESGAKKHLKGKLRTDLVTPEMINAIAEVMTYGSKKYDENNWRKGIPFMVSYAAAMRHLLAWVGGIDVDKESGIHHLKHAMCNLGMIITQLDKEELDNRYKD